MAFGIHALNIAYIVALLEDAPRNPRGIRSGQAAGEQATCGADGRAFRTAEDGTRCCSNAGAKGGTFRCAGSGGLAGCSAGLLLGKLPACLVVKPKLIKTSAIAGQRQHAGARRHAYTGRKWKYRYQRE